VGSENAQLLLNIGKYQLVRRLVEKKPFEGEAGTVP
jgi:hypothetical protein